LKTGYRPGEITFSLHAVFSNLGYMPAHLIYAMPMLVLGLAGLSGIIVRRARPPREDRAQLGLARCDFGVGLALAGLWLSVWVLYSAYTWTAQPGIRTFADSRFYIPAIGAIALLGAWLLVRGPRPARLAAVTPGAVVVAMFGMGLWSYAGMVNGG
jgi:hypothetical protein